MKIGESKSEANIRAKFVERFRERHPRWILFRHEDKSTSGVPDISITGEGRTVWIETKFADPDFETNGIQDLEMLRLASEGFAYYLIWQEVVGVRATFLVHPRDYADWEMKGLARPGFNHNWVIGELERMHWGETNSLY